MFIYLLTFTIAIICTKVAEYYDDRKNKSFFSIFSFFSVSSVVLLATFRDPGIGTDTLGYVKTTWNLVKSIPDIQDLLYEFRRERFGDIEFGYVFLNWVASRVSSDIHMSYFIGSCFTIIPLYSIIYYNRKHAPMWLSFALYLFLYYNTSYNLVRQSIALSFCIYSIKYIENKKVFLFILLCLWIYLLHNSSIIFLCFILLYCIFKMKNANAKFLILTSIFITLFFLFKYFDLILSSLIEKGIIHIHFRGYLSDYNTDIGFFDTSTTLVYASFILMLCIIYYAIKKSNTTREKSNILSFTIYNQTIGVILLALSVISKWMFRISAYINYPISCIYIPRCLKILKVQNKRLYNIIIMFMIILLLLYWIWYIGILNINETVPYKSKILGI